MPPKDKLPPDFKSAVKGVKPLLYDKVPRVIRNKTIAVATPVDLVTDKLDEKVLTTTDTVFYMKHHLPQKIQNNLKRGKFPIEDRIDLHGMTAGPAINLLKEFITECHNANYFLVAVIHGKGRKTPDKPVLKNKVNTYLRNDPQVLAFCTAKQQDGGTGAVYVLLEMN